MNKSIVALLAAVSTVPASAALFNFSQTIGTQSAYDEVTNQSIDPFLVNGSFEGDAAGNLITNISNVTLFINGQQVSGPIYIEHVELQNYAGWLLGGATVSFDGFQNNFGFFTSVSPSNSSAFYYSASSAGQDYARIRNVIGGSNLDINGQPSTLVVTAADVPEPAMLGLFGLGAIGLGLSRRRKA